jgi:hypothetical protein
MSEKTIITYKYVIACWELSTFHRHLKVQRNLLKSYCSTQERKLQLRDPNIECFFIFAVDTSSGSYLPNEIDGSCGNAVDVGQEDFGEYPFLAAVGYNVGGKVLYESDAILINR